MAFTQGDILWGGGDTWSISAVRDTSNFILEIPPVIYTGGLNDIESDILPVLETPTVRFPVFGGAHVVQIKQSG